jgi:DNA uptake protein ComE-like DNA-binding protein
MRLRRYLAFGWLLCAVATSVQAADVNRATAFQLEAVGGIGEQMAADIVAERMAHGRFVSWDDFRQRVKGVGEHNLKTMQKDGLTLNANP